MTFFDGSTPEGVVHVDVGEPYRPAALGVEAGGRQSRVDVIGHGVYGAYEGPRFETREKSTRRTRGRDCCGDDRCPRGRAGRSKDLPYASVAGRGAGCRAGHRAHHRRTCRQLSLMGRRGDADPREAARLLA